MIKVDQFTKIIAVLFVLFVLVNSVYLNRIPGLLGDEASEGENVFELLQAEKITVIGERSYIGPALDYVRVPFIKVFGYTALSLRAPLLIISLLTFILAAIVFRRLFNTTEALFAMVTTFFSIIYLTYQRLGWAISLFPFFTVLILFLATGKNKYKALLIGMVSGIALHNHILFFPTLAGLITVGIIVQLFRLMQPRDLLRRIIGYWPALIGFWAGFGTQFIVLTLMSEDQGDPTATVQLLSERLADVPKLLPLILSGSAYAARYTGIEYPTIILTIVTSIVLILAALALILAKRKRTVWLWAAGIIAHLFVLLYMIDRFTLRYFLMFVLGIWVLAGVGLGAITRRIFLNDKLQGSISIILAGVFCMIFAFFVLIPFNRTGGSTNDFSLGNRTNSAAALVDTRPLIHCLRGAGSVSSENVHILNRLQFQSHQFTDLVVMPESAITEVKWLVHYMSDADGITPGICPELEHFVIQAK